MPSLFWQKVNNANLPYPPLHFLVAERVQGQRGFLVKYVSRVDLPLPDPSSHRGSSSKN